LGNFNANARRIFCEFDSNFNERFVTRIAVFAVLAMVTAAITAARRSGNRNRNFTMRGECRFLLCRNDASATPIGLVPASP
jgi:hypothetical protein